MRARSPSSPARSRAPAKRFPSDVRVAEADALLRDEAAIPSITRKRQVPGNFDSIGDQALMQTRPAKRERGLEGRIGKPDGARGGERSVSKRVEEGLLLHLDAVGRELADLRPVERQLARDAGTQEAHLALACQAVEDDLLLHSDGVAVERARRIGEPRVVAAKRELAADPGALQVHAQGLQPVEDKIAAGLQLPRVKPTKLASPQRDAGHRSLADGHVCVEAAVLQLDREGDRDGAEVNRTGNPGAAQEQGTYTGATSEQTDQEFSTDAATGAVVPACVDQPACGHAVEQQSFGVRQRAITAGHVGCRTVAVSSATKRCPSIAIETCRSATRC